MKEGLYFENDALIYYRNGAPYHAGVIKVDGAIYYISSNGRAVKGEHIVHQSMANNILKRGTYTFGDDYKLVAGSYIAPKRVKKRKHKKKSSRRFHLTRKHALLISTCAVLVVVFCAVLPWVETILHPSTTPSTNATESTASDPTISLPSFEEDVLLCSSSAKSEFDGQLALKTAVQTGDPYRPFQFEYQLEGTSGLLLVSEDPSLGDAKTYELTEDGSYVLIDNLKTDTTYYYKVIIDGQETPGSFHTAPSTRFVSIPGLSNTRDIGGCVNQDGKTVKQGLLIRGVELDGLVNASYFIPAEDLETVQETFGFVYDMDLRSGSIYSGDYVSRLGIRHKFYNAPMYGGIFSEESRESLRQIFSDLADPQNYPMYLHCTWGTDRTGTVIFLLQGVLNLSEADMVREYELTGYTFSDITGSGNLNPVLYGLEPYEGDTLSEKIVTFLTEEIGVTESQIESIRTIFLAE